MSAPFRVALLGFSALERNALQTYFKLAATRQPRYEQVQLLPDADFIVADGDHLPSVHLVEAVERIGDTVFVGDQAPPGAAATVRRPLDTMKVLRELDGLAARASGSPPAPEAPLAAAEPPSADVSHGRARTVIQPPRPRKPSTVEVAGELAQSLWPESVPPVLPPAAAADALARPAAPPVAPVPPSAPVPPLPALRDTQPPPPPAPAGPPAVLPEISLRDVSALPARPARPPVARPVPRAGADRLPSVPPPSPPMARQPHPPPAPAKAKALVPDPARARVPQQQAPEARPVPPPPAPAAARSEPPVAPQARARPERRALVVDDSDVALHYLQGKLSEFGVGADVAEDSQAAQRLLAARDYDFVFLDVELGEASELDGLALCQLIKRQASMRNTVAATVVMVTAHHTELDRVRGTLAGCDAYLAKPLEGVELTRLMASHGLKPAGAKGDKSPRS